METNKSLLARFLAVIDLKINRTDHLKKWLSANASSYFNVGVLNSVWRKNVTQNNLAAWWSEKSKAKYGKLSAEIAVDTTSLNRVYRKLLRDARISHFFEKMFHVQRSLSTMKSYGVLLPLLLVLSGCLASPIKPSIYKMNEIRAILVVPVESPPLEVIPDLIETRFPVYSQYQYQAMPLSLILENKIYRNPGGVLIAGFVSKDDSVPVADFHLTPASTGKTPRLEPVASLQNNWSPTLVLAQEAVSLLNRDGGKATLSKHYYRLPIASEDRNANLGNWRNAIEQWYNQNMSPVDYRQHGLEHVDAVLEVGIETYRIFNAQTSLQVLIKLIDPNTQQVIGRISAKTFSVEDSPQTLLNHEAEKLKQLMTEMGSQLITLGFSDLGLPLIKPAQSAVDRLTP